MELFMQCPFYPLTCFITCPQLVTKRLYYVICGYTQVSCTFFNHLQHSMEYSHRGTKRLVLTLIEPSQPIEVPEKFICAVDKMNNHAWAHFNYHPAQVKSSAAYLKKKCAY